MKASRSSRSSSSGGWTRASSIHAVANFSRRRPQSRGGPCSRAAADAARRARPRSGLQPCPLRVELARPVGQRLRRAPQLVGELRDRAVARAQQPDRLTAELKRIRRVDGMDTDPCSQTRRPSDQVSARRPAGRPGAAAGRTARPPDARRPCGSGPGPRRNPAASGPDHRRLVSGAAGRRSVAAGRTTPGRAAASARGASSFR